MEWLMMDIKSFYYANPIKKGDRIQFKNSDFHHMRDVLRIKENSKIYLLTQNGKYNAVLIEYQKEFALLEIEEKICEENTLPNIHLMQGIPKSWKMDEIIEKATEMGVASIIPIYTSRSVPKYSKEEESHKMQRWEKIAISASKQSRRNTVPSIHTICELKEILAELDLRDEGKVFFWELETKQNLYQYLKYNIVKDFFILIGPEGGISYEEAEMAIQTKFQSCSLGASILRTETAGPFAVGLMRYLWNTIHAESIL